MTPRKKTRKLTLLPGRNQPLDLLAGRPAPSPLRPPRRSGALSAPPIDGPVVAPRQDLRHLGAHEFPGSRVLGILPRALQTLAEGFLHQAGLVAEYAGDLSDHRLHDGQGGHLAAREHVGAHRQLPVGEQLAYALVESLVT